MNVNEPSPAVLNLHPVTFAQAVCSQFQNQTINCFFLFQHGKVYLLKIHLLTSNRSVDWFSRSAGQNVCICKSFCNHRRNQLVFHWLKETLWRVLGSVYQQVLPRVSHFAFNWSLQQTAPSNYGERLQNIHPNSHAGFVQLKIFLMAHGASGGSLTSCLCFVDTLYIL